MKRFKYLVAVVTTMLVGFQFSPLPALAADTMAPSVPTNVVAIAVSSHQINVSWAASTDDAAVTGYSVYRNGGLIGNTSKTMFVDTGLAANSLYSYTVTAFDAANNVSSQSGAGATLTLPATSDSVAPSVPTGVIATAVAFNRIDLSWSPSTDNVGVVGYNIFRGGVLIASTLSTSYSDLGLTPSTSYSYGVSAFDIAGNISSQSAAATTSTLADVVAPSVPGGLMAAAISPSQIKLNWNASTDNVGVMGYNIYRNGSFVGSSATRDFTDAGLAASTAYSYRLAAFDAAGNLSAQSVAVVATTLAASGDTMAPTVPTKLRIEEVKATKVKLDWSASTDNVRVRGYNVYRDGILIGTTRDSEFKDSGVAASSTHSYRVSAFDAAGNVSALTAAITVTTLSVDRDRRDGHEKGRHDDGKDRKDHKHHDEHEEHDDDDDDLPGYHRNGHNDHGMDMKLKNSNKNNR